MKRLRPWVTACAGVSALAWQGRSDLHAQPAPHAHRRDLEAVTTFFATTAPPWDLALSSTKLQEFVAVQAAAGRRVALVTSGGTMVPLEKRTVRFVDNFSTGLRGAACAERLLSAGYAVVFLHRTGSKRPYSHAILDAVTAALDEPPPTMSPVSGADDTEQADTAAMLDALLASVVETSERHGGSLGALAAARRDGRLLELPYSSVADYLHKLRSASHAVSALQERGLILLAAAVSDFYVPTHKLVEHKIQSDPSAAAAAAAPGLSLHLDPVPKVLFPLKQQWAPRCCVISFKLETDEALLLKKAAGAIQAYGVDGVVANLLDKRYTQVQLVVPSASQPSGAGQEHPPAAAPVSLQLPVAVPGASITSKPLATSAADATAVGPSFQVITICTGSSSPSSPGAGSSSQQQSAASSSPPLPGLASPPAPAPAAVASTVPVMPLEDALAESIAALHGAHIARTQRSDVTSTDEPRMK